MVFKSRYTPVAELFGVPDPPKTGRARLVHAAIELFYRHGFQAVGIQQVIAAAGVTKTTFYKHFESKDDLLVAAVRQRDEWEMQAWTTAVRKLAGDDPKQQLLAYFDVLDIWFNSPDFLGCQFINAAAEFPNPHDPVHAAAAEHKRKSRDYFRDLAVAAKSSDAESFADHYTALVEGTLVLRQVHGRDDAARAIRPAVESLVRELP
jgi:AcrR family transcriptional regulator